jgi:cAMP phosphodiesterase
MELSVSCYTKLCKCLYNIFYTFFIITLYIFVILISLSSTSIKSRTCNIQVIVPSVSLSCNIQVIVPSYVSLSCNIQVIVPSYVSLSCNIQVIVPSYVSLSCNIQVILPTVVMCLKQH